MQGAVSLASHENAGLRLCVLGRFELRCGNTSIIDRRWPRTKAKALLKLLALQFGASMHRDQVLEVLWPEVPAAAAANNLHKNLHYLRSITGTGPDDAIVAVREGMVTLRQDVWIDAHQFVNSCLAARGSRSIDGLTLALGLYRGELLPDDPYEPWADRHRENLRALFVSGSLELSGLLEERGDLRGAIERTAAALQADPTVEGAHRMAMRQYAKSGNSARALQQYEQCRAILKRELDIEPHERTRRMRDRIQSDAAQVEAEARVEAAGEQTSRDAHAPPPAVHYTSTADGARVAYWTLGNGPGVPLVSMPVLPHTDIEREWEITEWRAWWERIAQGRTVVRYDCRAAGASRPGSADFSIDALTAELEAVREECGLDRMAIWAAHHSGPAAISYAVRYPERVSHLVLCGAYVEGRRRRATSDEQRREAAVQVEMVRLGWGREDPAFRRFFTSSFIPDASLEDEAVLVGRQGDERLRAEQLAEWCGTIPYEIVARIHPGLPRVVREG